MENISGIATWLAEFSGISTAIIGSHNLSRAVQQRLRITGLADVSTYHRHLLASPDEQQCLVELVVVPETWFFRDRHPYDLLRAHVTDLLRVGRSSGPLRLLSAPCATGEEPYSMAITLREMGLAAGSFSIDAIDICRQAIRRARRAVYGRHSFRGVSEAEQQRHFELTPRGLALQPALRDTVQFRRSNLMTCLLGMASRYDVIFCRNLLIYLEESAAQQLLASLAALLRPGGLLIVGSAEPARVPATLFAPVSPSSAFGFLRREDPPAVPPAGPDRLAGRPASASASGGSHPARRRRPARPGLIRPDQPSSAADHAEEAGRSQHAVMLEQDLDHWRAELQRHPFSEAAHLRLARGLARQQRDEEAMDCLRRCLYVKPECRDALELMIRLCDRLGQSERSRQLQARLERLDP